MPMSTYREVVNDIPRKVGVLVPIPKYADKHEEFEKPTELQADIDWKLCVIICLEADMNKPVTGHKFRSDGQVFADNK